MASCGCNGHCSAKVAMSRLNVKKYTNRRSQTVRCAHAESENEFNVTVQSKASEAATVTLVGR